MLSRCLLDKMKIKIYELLSVSRSSSGKPSLLTCLKKSVTRSETRMCLFYFILSNKYRDNTKKPYFDVNQLRLEEEYVLSENLNLKFVRKMEKTSFTLARAINKND